MNCTDCTAKLNDYLDRELATADVAALEAHVATCANCRAELEALRALLNRASDLPKAIAPQRDLWSGIYCEVARLDPKSLAPGETADRSHGGASGARSNRSTFSWFAPLAMAASVAWLCVFVERNPQPGNGGPGWAIAALAGAPRVNSRPVAANARLHVGQWLVTDAASRAEVTVSDIGRVTVDPNSRLRLTTAEKNNQRLELKRGSLSAFIYAPPRIFFVDTPSATAVDLGCAYTLNVADNGDGELRVTLGYVALEHGARASIIPSGAMCLTRTGAGPGTPFIDDAPQPLRTALERFDFGPAATRSAALADIFAHVRDADAITLWHLLARTDATDRARVFETLAKLRPPPASVTRAGILAGDADMRARWAAELGLGTW